MPKPPYTVPFEIGHPPVTQREPFTVKLDFYPFVKQSEAEKKQMVAKFLAWWFQTFVLRPSRPVCVQVDWLYVVGYGPFTRVERALTTRSLSERGMPRCIGTVEHVE